MSKVIQLDTRVSECDQLLEDSKGKFESIVIIGFYDGKFNEAYKCSEGESERVVLAQILQSAIAQELLDDLMED